MIKPKSVIRISYGLKALNITKNEKSQSRSVPDWLFFDLG